MSDSADSEPSSTVEEDNSRTAGSNADEISKMVVEITKIREFGETAKVVAKEATESKNLIVAALADAHTKLGEINTVATQAVAAMTKVVDDQAVIATKSDHIQNAQIHADKVRGDLDRVLTAATKQATDAEGMKTRAQTAADNATQLLTEVRTTKGTVEANAEAVSVALTTAEASAGLTKSLADKASTIETRIKDYEGRLANLEDRCANQLKTIEGLLPGAASAGLAHAFDERRQTFLAPQRKWENWFIGSVSALVVLATFSFLERYFVAHTPILDEALLYWVFRIPVAGALVWLAIHSSHEAALAKRLEEDYGYKSAVASSFMGFHKQMSEVGAAAASNAPLTKLFDDTLATIASPPGRIYDQHKLTASLADELSGAAKAMRDVINSTGLKGGT